MKTYSPIFRDLGGLLTNIQTFGQNIQKNNKISQMITKLYSKFTDINCFGAKVCYENLA